MIGNQPAIGDRVHHDNRRHPTKSGWLQANGKIVNIFLDEDDEDYDEVQEVLVEFGEDDFECYATSELEWCPDLGGYWRVS